MFGLFGPNVEKMRQDGDVVGLISLLNHKKQKIREKAAQALAAIGPPAVKPLTAVLQSEDQYTCNYAAWALGVIADDRAVEPLIEALNDTRRSLRRNVARALLVMADPRAIDPLISALGDPCMEVQRLAVRALGSFGGARAVEALLEYQSSHKFSDEIIVNALAKIGQSAVEPLINALGNEHYSVVGVVAAALGKIRDPRALDPLVYTLRKRLHPEIANALEMFHWEPATTLDAACYAAAKRKWEQCLEIGAAALEVLTKVINDPGWPETGRQEARETLARITDVEQQEVLVEEQEDVEEHRELDEPEGTYAIESAAETEAGELAGEVEKPATIEQPVIDATEPESPEAGEPTPNGAELKMEAPEAGTEITEQGVEVSEAEFDAPEASFSTDVIPTTGDMELEQIEEVSPVGDTDTVSLTSQDTPMGASTTVSTRMKERVEDIIYSRVRPMLRTDGRDIKVADVTEGVVYVSLKCEYTGSDRLPIENAVSSRIRELIEEIVFVKFV